MDAAFSKCASFYLLTRENTGVIMCLVIQSIYEWQVNNLGMVIECGVMKLNDKYETQMKKGVLDMLVLQLLAERKMYGYQIISELSVRSEERFLLKEGTLYPILYRLEDDGLVKSQWSEAEGKRVARKYYRITEDGKETLLEIKELWKEISGSVEKIMEE